MTPITIVITDDHRVVASSLKAYLESFPDLRVVGVAPSGEALLAQVRAWSPAIVLLDLLMPGGIDGVETVAFVDDPADRCLHGGRQQKRRRCHADLGD